MDRAGLVVCNISLSLTPFPGQGVVLERSAFSDSVIAQALHENHLLSDDAWRFYIRDLVPGTLPDLWKPHVVIYLDKPTEDCLKSIQQNGKVSGQR